MKVLERGTMPNGTAIQIEEWHENYDFYPYADCIASYPKSKMSHEGAFAPKGNEKYRFSFHFPSTEDAKNAYNELLAGTKQLVDFVEYMWDKKYVDCI